MTARFLRRSPASHLPAIRVLWWHGFNTAEIAEKLGLSEAQVANSLGNALALANAVRQAPAKAE